MAVNKVVINGQTKIDLSGDTVDEDKVISGYTFHDPQGVQKTGTYDPGESWTAILKIKTTNPDLFNQQITITKSQDFVVAKVTLHGAVGAAISWTDLLGSHLQLLNSNGEAANIFIVANPNNPDITFTDTTISKDPTNLSNNFTKTVTITDQLTDIYIMPDNALYWYGWESNNLENCTVANGWTTISGRTMDTPVHNTNDIYLAATAGGHVSYVGSKNPCDITSSYSAIINSTSISSGAGLSVDDLETKYVEYGVNYLTTTGLQVKTVSASGSKYLAVGSNNGSTRAGYLYGLWHN